MINGNSLQALNKRTPFWGLAFGVADIGVGHGEGGGLTLYIWNFTA